MKANEEAIQAYEEAADLRRQLLQSISELRRKVERIRNLVPRTQAEEVAFGDIEAAYIDGIGELNKAINSIDRQRTARMQRKGLPVDLS